MTTKLQFAPWVAPIAEQWRQNRRAIVELARSLPAEAWARPSPNEGWTYRELLAHIAHDTDKNLHDALRLAAEHREIDASLWDDLDARNARGIKQRAERSIDELTAEIEADGERLQELLTLFGPDDGSREAAGIDGTIADWVRDGLAQHDALHLGQLRTAAEER